MTRALGGLDRLRDLDALVAQEERRGPTLRGPRAERRTSLRLSARCPGLGVLRICATHTAMATSRANNAPIVQYVKHGGITNQLFKQVFADAASF